MKVDILLIVQCSQCDSKSQCSHMWVHWLLLDSQVFTSILQSMYSHVPSKSQCSHMWVHWLKNCAITFNLHDKLFYSVATIVVFNNDYSSHGDRICAQSAFSWGWLPIFVYNNWGVCWINPSLASIVHWYCDNSMKIKEYVKIRMLNTERIWNHCDSSNQI